MKNIFIPLLFVLMLSCSLNQSEPEAPLFDTDINSDSTTFFPAKPLQVLSKKEVGLGADLRLSFTKSSASGRSIIYTVNSLYENKNIGFEISVPINGYAKLTFKSTGTNSDNFIQLLSKLYKQEVDTNQKFTDLAVADCIDLGEYIDNLNKPGNGNYTAPAHYKLILKDDNHWNSATIYLNINPNEHWIEIGEKSDEYRPSVIAILSKK